MNGCTLLTRFHPLLGEHMVSAAIELVCVHCDRRWPATEGPNQWLTCSNCGPTVGILDFEFDLDAVAASWREHPLLSRPRNHWRYRELLPIDANLIPPSWQVGWTPILETPRLAREIGVARLWCKDEGRNPTASFKDRASSLAVVHALQRSAQTIACASTGNAATSLAGHAALAGLPAVIFVPETAPEPKLAQLLVYGAKVVAVQGTYDEAYQLCSAACERFGWYNRNCAINPILVEGKKTAGLEIAEQCRLAGEVPDWVAVSVGDGCTIAGVWKGLQQMRQMGLIDRLPRMLGVQAAGVAPVQYALEHGQLPNKATQFAGTIADSIDVAVPRNWIKAVRAIQKSDGVMVTIDDQSIYQAMRSAGKSGVFAEPAAAAAVAGLGKAVQDGIVKSNETALAMITGSGLKDTKGAICAGGEPIRIPPDLELLQEHHAKS